MWKFLYRANQFFSRFTGRQTCGVRAIVLNNKNEILLVRHSYIDGWYLPGGGVEPSESFFDAIRRELKEEVGIDTGVHPQTVLGTYFSTQEGRYDRIVLFLFRNCSQSYSNDPEIAEYQWINPCNLPNEISPATRRRIQEFSTGSVIESKW